MSGVLLEARAFRPFKSSEEYLYAMKEDLAEWLLTLYPHLRISVDNFMDRLETGVALCDHANAVKAQAYEYVQKKQARKMMTRSVTGSVAQAQTLTEIADVRYFPTAKAGTFFARDNVSNFIHWCRQSLKIIECLLFETDDLIMRKNEKHVILCLLEVARRGAKFGMLAPMLIQMERQIDREIAADQKKQKSVGTECDFDSPNNGDEDSDSETDDEQPMMVYGPLPQIITNDLKSLDEMVRDLVAKCTCPTQFPMIRVSEGKYRIGDTKVLIFVRILRSHVMVRVGGGWDTLAHYLDKHDPCRCRSQHRTTQGARLVNKPGAMDLQGAQVYYDRSPPRLTGTTATPTVQHRDHLGPPMHSLNRSRSRSPSHIPVNDARRSISPNPPRKSTLAPPRGRSRSPTPNYTSTHSAKLTNGKAKTPRPSSPCSLPILTTWTAKKETKNGKMDGDNLTDHSDNASEVSDEGYRSLGVVQTEKGKNRASLYSQNSVEDVEENEHLESDDHEDNTNDAGLRRTHFSQIYLEKASDTPTSDTPTSDTPTLTKQYSSEKSSRSSSRERSETLTPPPTRPARKSPSPAPTPKHASKHHNKTANSNNNNNARSTWNGRSKSVRPSLGVDTFAPPSPPTARFQRHGPGRRSVSAASFERRGSSSTSTTPTATSPTATSPTKGRLRDELLKAVRSHRDDVTIAEHVRKLLKKYGSLSVLDDEKEDGHCGSPRKDSRRPNVISRIPAPISHRV